MKMTAMFQQEPPLEATSGSKSPQEAVGRPQEATATELIVTLTATIDARMERMIEELKTLNQTFDKLDVTLNRLANMNVVAFEGPKGAELGSAMGTTSGSVNPREGPWDPTSGFLSPWEPLREATSGLNVKTSVRIKEPFGAYGPSERIGE